MYVCILNQDGEIMLHRNMKASPEPLLKAIPRIATISALCVPAGGAGGRYDGGRSDLGGQIVCHL
jgi:hypothetical protein